VRTQHVLADRDDHSSVERETALPEHQSSKNQEPPHQACHDRYQTLLCPLTHTRRRTFPRRALSFLKIPRIVWHVQGPPAPGASALPLGETRGFRIYIGDSAMPDPYGATGFEPTGKRVMLELRKQAVTGLVPPELGEALIREARPSVTAHPAPAGLGRALTRTIILAPLGWLLMAPVYFLKILPFVGRRYTLTNRRLMIRTAYKGRVVEEVALADIDDVKLVTDANSEFFRAASLEIVSHGKVVMTLRGVPEAESFRHTIINALKAWVPGKAAGPFVPAKAAT
jgi:hypothetical protein